MAALVPPFVLAAGPAERPDDSRQFEHDQSVDQESVTRQDAEQPPSVEDLLDRLSQAESETEARALERQVVGRWNRSGSDTVDMLAARASAAIKQKDYAVSLQYLDTIVAMMPSFAEGWNMRATVYFLMDEYELSLADIQQVLAIQPRHFGALSGLGMIFRDLDQPAKALDAFRQVLSVHPYFGNARESVKKLEPKVEGRDI